ncbi:hypothetical protein HRI_000252200 [Hibiscus trionum]|uniref:Uncharacterized protein n=1 Tax=Hibiscus trionum TaxID=183268 RepID=A0A9W7GUF9_HIBTR|nr:hypothetical protein HRI_000252200 [Hibiscus trionum]
MCDYELPSDFDIQGLSLIDVTVEDDCLIDPPLLDHISDGELEEDETRRNGRRKLHKSMTWDSSFFCSAAFLEPEEFSSREDANRSRDSSTMLDGEALIREHPEADFDEDIRASTQKSNRLSGNAVNKELGTKDSRNVSSPKKSEYPNHDKVKRKAALRKPNIATKDPGKIMKHVSARPQTSKSFGRIAALTSPRHKPPKVVGRRASVSAKDIIMEKDAKSAIDRETTISKAPALDGSKNIVPRTTSSRSSPLYSPMICNSSIDTIKQNDSGLVNSSSSSYTFTDASKSAAKRKSRLGLSAHSTLLKSPTNPHSSMPVASSSCSEWSSESSLSSPTSTANKKYNVVRGSLGSGSHKGLVTDSGAKQLLDSQSRHTRHPSMGDGDEVTGSLDESESKVSDGSTGLLHPAAIKPSALRPPSPKLAFSNGVSPPSPKLAFSNGVSLPSPKLGVNPPSPKLAFSNGVSPPSPKLASSNWVSPPSPKPPFSNGVRSSRHTRTRSVPSLPAAAIGMPKIGAKSTNPSGDSNKAPPRTLQRPTTGTAATKVQSSSRNPKVSPGMSPKLKNKPSQKTGRGSYSKAQAIGSAEKIVGSDFPKLVVKLGGKDGSRIKDTKVVPLAVPDDLAPESEVLYIIASKEAPKNETKHSNIIRL